jgi:cold shock CspA family protein
MQGFIDRLFFDKGYGFIRVEGEDSNIFFHMNSCVNGLVFDSLKAFDKVEFETYQAKRGRKALRVRKIE